MGYRTITAFVMLLALLSVPAVLSPWYGWGSTPGKAVTFTVAKGATLAEVAVDLDKADLVSTSGQFRILARLLGSGAPIQAGTYRLVQGAGWRSYLETMQKGTIVRETLTIPEGMPSVLVAERLRAETQLSGPVAVPPEGSVLPETYDFTPGEPRARVLARMQAAMQATLASLWQARTPLTVVKTPAEAVTLASIVEKETGKSAERRQVAGVYSNRLKAGIKLDADPTIIYPITRGKPLGRRIRLSEKNAVNDYNTYAMTGLPKGPIANPGKASIAAVLDPAPTKALYFVADGTGGHVFASTLAEHNANVAKWFAIRRARGEM